MTTATNTRTILTDSISKKKYDYRSAPRRHIEQALFLTTVFLVTLYYFDAMYLWILLTAPVIVGYGTVLVVDLKRNKDFIILTGEGISFMQRGEAGFMTWDSIKEIICRRHKSGVDYMIKTSSTVLTFNKEITPADQASSSFFKRFLFNYRYANELLKQIREVVPHVPYHSGI